MALRTAADSELLINAFRTLPPPVLPRSLTHMTPPVFTVDEMCRAAGLKHGLPPPFIKGVIAAESAFEPKAVSPKGALGLMQLMPETAREMGAVDPMDPAQNIDAGATYLSQLMARYGTSQSSLERVLAAYNAGPGNVDKYHGIPPFKETRSYVKRVLGFYRYFKINRLF